jgi:hypothetical protein
MSPRRGSTPRRTDWLTVSCKVTLTLTLTYRHSRYQARKNSTNLLLSGHRSGTSESATTVIADQHSSTDRPHCSRRIGRLLSRCPSKPASDRPEISWRSLFRNSLTRPLAARIVYRQCSSRCRHASLQPPELSHIRMALFRATRFSTAQTTDKQ